MQTVLLLGTCMLFPRLQHRKIGQRTLNRIALAVVMEGRELPAAAIIGRLHTCLDGDGVEIHGVDRVLPVEEVRHLEGDKRRKLVVEERQREFLQRVRRGKSRLFQHVPRGALVAAYEKHQVFCRGGEQTVKKAGHTQRQGQGGGVKDVRACTICKSDTYVEG